MGGFFGTVSKAECVTDLFYGTDYNSHLGTKRGGLATYAQGEGFMRSIHNLESSYFRTKFESELPKFKGSSGIGIISDTDPQPIVINSHLGKFAIVTVAKINNITELERDLLAANMHFSEMSLGKTNQTELIALLIVQGKNFVDGIENVFNKIKGSCSMLILTEDGIIAARDKWGRTPIVIGKKEGAYAATSESSSLPNLDYEIEKYVGPGEIIRLRADGMEQMRKPNEGMQICSFLWVYYGFPVSCYEGKNVEEVRFMSGYKMGPPLLVRPSRASAAFSDDNIDRCANVRHIDLVEPDIFHSSAVDRFQRDPAPVHFFFRASLNDCISEAVIGISSKFNAARQRLDHQI